MDNLSLQILLVEDDSTDVLLLEEALEGRVGASEFVLTCVNRLDTALRYLQDRRFDAVLLDLGLPDSQGLDGFARLHQQNSKIPILILSGLNDESLAVQAVQNGAQDYLVKGVINSIMLARTIRYAIERKRSEQKLLASEVSYRRLFETAQDGIFILDAETGQITDANPFLEELLGYAVTEFIGKRLWEIGPFRHKAASQAAFHTLKEQGYIRYEDLPLATKDGRFIDVEFSSNVYTVGSQRVIQCNIRDISERKLADHQLQLHSHLLNVIGQAVIVTDTAGTITYWNEFAEKLYGWSSSEVLGRNILDVTPPSTTQEQAAEILSCLTRGESWSGEFIAQKRDGTTFPVYVADTPVLDEVGNTVSIIGLSLDISERKNAEERLRRSEERYRAFIAATSEAIWRFELEQPIPISLSEDEQIEWLYRYFYLAECNDAMARMYGFASSHEIVGARLGDLLVRSDPANIDSLQAFIRSGYHLRDTESHEPDRQGQTKYFLNNLVGIVENGALQRVWGTQRDITERRRVEESLRQSEANLARAQQIAHLGSWEKDLVQTEDFSETPLRWSDEVFRINGYEPGQIEVSSENFFRRVHPDDREHITAAMAQAVREGKDYSIDHRIILPDGTERIVHEQAEIVLDEHTGKPLKMVGTVQDITERKQAEVRQSLLVQGLNQVVTMADELLASPDLDHLLHQAVELAREKLGLERCSLHLVDQLSQELYGTYGTTLSGETNDERKLRIPIAGFWAEHLLLPQPANNNRDGFTGSANHSPNRWEMKTEYPLTEYKVEGGQVSRAPIDITGWVAATPILAGEGEGAIGVMFNDPGQAKVPVDEIKQELLVVYCSLLGNIIERKQAEEALHQSHDELETRVAKRTAELNKANESLQVEVIERKMAMDTLRQTAEAFRATQQMLQLVMNHIPQAIFWKDRNSVFLGCNYRLALDQGFASPDEVKGKSDFDLNPAEYAAEYQADDRQVMETDTPKLNIEETSLQANGNLMWLRTNKIPLHDSQDNVVGILGTYEDITEIKHTEEALQQAKAEAERANLAKSEFLSRMSHELRTPLNAILGFGQILDKQKLDPLSKESIGYILKGGRHLLDLINEVLDFARVDAGHIELSLEAIALHDVIPEACALVRPLAAERSIRLYENTSALNRHHVMADRQRLIQVLINLLSNAIKYNREAGQVEICCTQKPDGWTSIAISDTGPGIAPEDLPKLFVPFERLSAGGSEIEGTGLGLVLSERLVAAMGGTLQVESILGRGTTFTITLPQATAPEKSLPISPADSHSVATLDADIEPAKAVESAYSILCIEDNPSNLRLIEVILRRRPHIAMLAAIQGSIGLDLARQHEPDLILLDLNLPDIHGIEVLAHLQHSALTRDIPVVVISADATPKQVERLLAAGARDYITKPLDVGQFFDTLDKFLPLAPTPI